MAVALGISRNTKEFTYDATLVQGDTIDVDAKNVVTDEVGQRKGLKNDGRFELTYPDGFVGTDEITVRGSDGGEDTGVVEIS